MPYHPIPAKSHGSASCHSSCSDAPKSSAATADSLAGMRTPLLLLHMLSFLLKSAGDRQLDFRMLTGCLDLMLCLQMERCISYDVAAST